MRCAQSRAKSSAHAPASGARRQWMARAAPLGSTPTAGRRLGPGRRRPPAATGASQGSASGATWTPSAAQPLEAVDAEEADGRAGPGQMGGQEGHRAARDHGHGARSAGPAGPGCRARREGRASSGSSTMGDRVPSKSVSRAVVDRIDRAGRPGGRARQRGRPRRRWRRRRRRSARGGGGGGAGGETRGEVGTDDDDHVGADGTGHRGGRRRRFDGGGGEAEDGGHRGHVGRGPADGEDLRGGDLRERRWWPSGWRIPWNRERW